MSHPVADRPHAPPATAALPRVVPAVAAILLGSFLIYGVGFAPLEVVHNAAHDGRHSFAFPCH